MRKQFFVFLLLPLLAHCDDASFKSGGTSSQQTDQQPAAEPASGDTQPSSYFDSNGSPLPPPQDCVAQPVTDESAHFEFKHDHDVTKFVNELCKMTIPLTFVGAGAVRNDPASAKIICQVKGYRNALVTDRFSWDSPKNNNVAWWDEAQKRFILKYDARGNNDMIKGLKCSGLYYDVCKPKIDVVSCGP